MYSVANGLKETLSKYHSALAPIYISPEENIHLKNAFAGILFAICAVAARADGWYLGASAGVVNTNSNGFDDATNAGLLIGYDVYTKDIFATSIETEFTTSVSDGNVKISGTKGSWDVDTQAAYVAFRLGEKFYIKTRFGVLRSEISLDIAGNSLSDTDSSMSWSGALGWMFNQHLGIQADGTLIDSDTTYWNLGLVYRF